MTFRLLNIFLIPAILITSSGCRQSIEEPPPSLPSGDFTLTVATISLDEFGLRQKPHGEIALTLIATNGQWQAKIADGDSVYSFVGLAPIGFLLKAEKPGFYPAELVVGGAGWGWSNTMRLVPTPSSLTRIDSIICTQDSAYAPINVRMVTPTTAPPNGYRNGLIFVGLTPNVGPASYSSSYWVSQSGGSNSYFGSFREYQNNFVSGTVFYVTGRILSSSSVSMYDPATGRYAYTNVEENTHVVTSIRLK